MDESFFQDLQQKYPEICGWESSRKLGTIDSELTRFRYDVMLRVNKKHAREENPASFIICPRTDIHGKEMARFLLRHVRIGAPS
ncbi:hypothetical protein P7H20_19090 [Paenibacillus larvae]|nr:hypothetical protein [Paenibacillus larvae]MDT2276506.1 hypothetical protein [Paenibacillus larvae]